MNFLKSNSGSHFTEHHGWYYRNEIIPEEVLPVIPDPILFMGKMDAICFAVGQIDRKVYTDYYIGIDWIQKNELAVYVQPKLNKDGTQIDYLQMFFDALKHPEVRNYTDEVFELKTEAPFIEIQEHQDLITPLLVLQFLQTVKDIVRKGLKKGYYRNEENLYGRVKGKVLVAQTIKRNLLKNKLLYTTCSYDKFGTDIHENRLLKKAIIFATKYLAQLKIPGAISYFTDVSHFITPAFEEVSDDISGFEIKHFRHNPFYKDYKKGIELAQLILRRFGYNITNTQSRGRTKVPPFWIDMSKLFELYVFSILKKEYGEFLHFQFSGKRTYVDYIVNKKGNEVIIDAKYKPRYKTEFDMDDIRQLSGYGRDEKVLNKLGVPLSEMFRTVCKCLIIYPDQVSSSDLWMNPEESIHGFVNFFKQAIQLPLLANSHERDI